VTWLQLPRDLLTRAPFDSCLLDECARPPKVDRSIRGACPAARMPLVLPFVAKAPACDSIWGSPATPNVQEERIVQERGAASPAAMIRAPAIAMVDPAALATDPRLLWPMFAAIIIAVLRFFYLRLAARKQARPRNFKLST
jgi:hypothetical protein